MKSCSKCGTFKDISEFYDEKRRPCAKVSECKECIKKSRILYNQNNPDKRKLANKKYRESKSMSFYTTKRVADKIRRTPKWLSEEHLENIKNIYIKAKTISIETGVPHEVDHIIPLRGKICSGLHVPWNLQIITRSENRKKTNK